MSKTKGINLIDIPIGKDLIQTIFRLHSPQCNIVKAERCKRAYMNKVYDVKTKYPKRNFIIKISNQPYQFGLEKEKEIIQLISNETDVPVPEIIYHDFSKKHFPFKYMVLKKIDGFLLQDIWKSLGRKDKESIMYESGKILAKIHGIKYPTFGYIDKDNIFHKCNSLHEHFSITNNNIREIIKKENLIDENLLGKIESIVKHSGPLLKTCGKPCLTHNDFFFWHLFVKKLGKKWIVNGLIDFGFSGRFAKESDFVKPDRWIFNKGNFIKQKFMEGYTSIQELNPQHDTLLDLFRIHFDLWFFYRLKQLKNERLANYYLNEIIKRVERWTV